MNAARFFAKIYDHTGVTIRQTLASTDILGLPNIVREVGSPASDILLDIAKPWDGYGYGESDGLNLYDLVKLYAVTPTDPAGTTLVYIGHITEIEAIYEAGGNHVRLRIMPIDALLTMSFFRDGSDFFKAYTSADIDDIFSDAISHANSVYGSFFTPALASPGKSVTVTFDQEKHSAILTKAGALLDEDWFWHIAPDGTIKLDQYAGTADHTFTAGKDADQFSVTRSILTLDNGYRLAWGGTPTYGYYSDATSESTYGRRESAEEDNAIQNSGSADIKGAAYVAKNKDPKSKVVVVINSRYPIESILPGDTCRILNTKAGALPSGIRRIIRVEYDGERAVLHLDDVTDNLGVELGKSL